MLTETLHSIGVYMMVFVVMPSFEPIAAGLVSLNMGVFPAFFKIIYPARSSKKHTPTHEENRNLRISSGINCVAFVLHLAAIILWCYYVYHSDGNTITSHTVLLVCMLLSPIFISIGYWENYVRRGDKESVGLPLLKRRIGQGKTKITILTSLWKLVLMFGVLPSIFLGPSCHNSVDCIKAFYFHGPGSWFTSPVGDTFVANDTNGILGLCTELFPFILAILVLVFEIIVFKVAKAACKIVAHKVGYALPMALITPASIGLILAFYSGSATISITGCITPFPTWNGDAMLIVDEISSYWLALVAGSLSYLSLLLITNHVWSPSKERLQSTDK